MFLAVMLAAGGWLDDANNLSQKVVTTGKAAGTAAAVVFVLLAYVAKRTLGAVFAALIVAGLVLYGINHTDTLQTKTQQEIGMSVGAGAGGGGGGSR